MIRCRVSLLTFQLLQHILTTCLSITLFTISKNLFLFIQQCYKRRTAAIRYPMRAPLSRSARYSRGRKRNIFYSRTLTWKGTFIFADHAMNRARTIARAPTAPLFLLSSKTLAGISMPYSWAGFKDGERRKGEREREERFNGWLTIYGYIARAFKEFCSFFCAPPRARGRRPSQFSVFLSPNRPANDSASCFDGFESFGLAAGPAFVPSPFAWRDIPSNLLLICLSSSCFRVYFRSSAESGGFKSRRLLHYSRDEQINFRIFLLFYGYNIVSHTQKYKRLFK